MDYLDYVSLSWYKRAAYQIGNFFKKLFSAIAKFLIGIPMLVYHIFSFFGRKIKYLVDTFVEGDAKTRISYIIMGFSNFTRKQFAKGLIYLLCEVSFVWYMVSSGAKSITGLITLGTQHDHIVIGKDMIPVDVKGDNSMLFLLAGAMTLAVIVFFIIIYFMNITSSINVQRLQKKRIKIPTLKDDMQDYLDKKFHVTLMALPVIGIVIFTVLPLIFMILIAFTNYDTNHQVPGHLFHWVGLDTFKTLFGIGSNSGQMSQTFWPVLGWTMIWAVAATFLNYILGMLIAMLINKKGIRCKKLFRTMFVLSVAVPQFVTLLLMREMLDDQGPINSFLLQMGWIKSYIPFLTGVTQARISVIIVDLWIGIPYTILITTGILMNIPAELYESAKIDGASAFTTFRKITLPYMLFVTTPYLITQFTGNINNFNVIYLLTGGNPGTNDYYQAGKTDLLVTWLYKLTLNSFDYCFASAIGIFVFVISAIISLLIFRNTNSYKNEEEFQ